MTKLGVLHPGNMGISVAASAANSGCAVHWASTGRSEATRARAAKHALVDVGTVEGLCAACEVIVSVCPPHAALDVARQVRDCGYGGIYLDANAVSPGRMGEIDELLTPAGITLVDGGIVGGPAWEPNNTWLYLSGADAEKVADCFSAGPLETTLLGPEIGRASALKMCYGAWTKGSTALLCAIVAAADAMDVWEPLKVQWERNWPSFPDQTASRVRRVTAKAWRFSGEMQEVAQTLEDVCLPVGFYEAASDLYRRIAHFKGAPEMPPLEEVLAALVRPDPGEDSSGRMPDCVRGHLSV